MCFNCYFTFFFDIQQGKEDIPNSLMKEDNIPQNTSIKTQYNMY